MSRPGTLRTSRGLWVGRPGGGIAVEILFEEEGREFAGESAGPLFALGEGNGRFGLLGVVVEVEDRGSLEQPLVAEALVIVGRKSRWGVHGITPKKGCWIPRPQ